MLERTMRNVHRSGRRRNRNVPLRRWVFMKNVKIDNTQCSKTT